MGGALSASTCLLISPFEVKDCGKEAVDMRPFLRKLQREEEMERQNRAVTDGR